MKLRSSMMLKTACAAFLGLALLPNAAVAGEVRIPNAKGEVVLSQSPRKIAAFDLATLDILHALGADVVVGVPKGNSAEGNFPAYMSEYGQPQYRNIGTLFEPDLAALNAIKPDLIVVGGRSAKHNAALQAIAPTVDLATSDKGLVVTAIDNTRVLGKALGLADHAEKRIAAFESEIAQLHAAAAKQGTGLMLFAVGQGAVVHAPGDRFGTLYDFVGIRSAVPAAKPSEGPAAPRPAAGSPEAIAAAAERDKAFAAALASEPDWLFVLDRTAVSATPEKSIEERLRAMPGVAQSKAWKAGRVVYLDPKTWYLVGAGIEALSGSAKDIQAAFAKAGQ